jgi:hypothetical protein
MSEMGPQGPENEHERVRFAKDAMARDLRDFYGISYDAAMQLVEEMHEKARREKEAKKYDTGQEED